MIFHRKKLINLIVEIALNLDYARKNEQTDKKELIFLITKDIKRVLRELTEKDRQEILRLLEKDDYKRGKDILE